MPLVTSHDRRLLIPKLGCIVPGMGMKRQAAKRFRCRRPLSPKHSSWRNRRLVEIGHAIQLGLRSAERPQLDRTRCSGCSTVKPVEQVLGGRVTKAAYHGMYYNGTRLRPNSSR